MSLPKYNGLYIPLLTAIYDGKVYMMKEILILPIIRCVSPSVGAGTPEKIWFWEHGGKLRVKEKSCSERF